jgi:hypothetical protein
MLPSRLQEKDMSRLSMLGAIGLAIAACAGNANAVSLSANGLGQVLLYPYYTVNNGQDTLISLVNTGDLDKVVKVRFKEGVNGRSVFELDVFLAGYDVWTAAVTAAAGGGALLRTSDQSCTLPEIPPGGAVFSAAGYDGSQIEPPGDDGSHDIARTREGSVEVIASADLVPFSITATAIEHYGALTSCGTLASLQIATDSRAPTQTLFGSGSIVDVGTGIFFGYNAEALRDFTAVMLFDANDPTVPTLAQANTQGTDNVRAIVQTADEAALAIDYAYPVDAVSAVLMKASLIGEYITDPGLGATTDWIVSFPTRSFYVDKVLYPTNATAPFMQAFEQGSAFNPIVPSTFDREGSGTVNSICPEPPLPDCPPEPVLANYQVNAISVRSSRLAGNPSGVFDSLLASTLVPFAPNGWARLDLTSNLASLPTSEGNALLKGLPAIGFMAYDIVNANANPGLLANYSGLFPLHAEPPSCAGVDCTATPAAIVRPASRRGQ